MKNKKIILASASPRRRELLAQLGLVFEIRPSSAEEVTKCEKTADMVMELSHLKAADIFEGLSEEEAKEVLVIGADTVVALDSEVMGKPGSLTQAKAMLLKLQGRTHHVYTGVTLMWQDANITEPKEKIFYEDTAVEIYPMTEEEIDSYLVRENCMDKAGAYAIQGSFAAHIKGIKGDYNNVVGLPIGRLYQEMKTEKDSEEETS